MATKLERLLRGDKATYRKNEITLVIQHPNALISETQNISLFYREPNEPIQHWWLSEEEINNSTDIQFLTPDRPRTIEDGLRKGDIIIDTDGDRRKILGVIDDVIIPSGTNDYSESGLPCTKQELIGLGYKLVIPEEEEKGENKVYLTFEDISAGKGVGIAPERTCIIDQNKQ